MSDNDIVRNAAGKIVAWSPGVPEPPTEEEMDRALVLYRATLEDDSE